jgi:hypothetical protein
MQQVPDKRVRSPPAHRVAARPARTRGGTRGSPLEGGRPHGRSSSEVRPSLPVGVGHCHEALRDLHEVATGNVGRVERRRVGALEAGPNAAVNPAARRRARPRRGPRPSPAARAPGEAAAVCRCRVGAGPLGGRIHPQSSRADGRDRHPPGRVVQPGVDDRRANGHSSWMRYPRRAARRRPGAGSLRRSKPP